MNVNEVPQDKRDLSHDGEIRKVIYAVGKDGKYQGVNYEGWDAENFVMKQAWDDIDDTLAATEKQVRGGDLSPVIYFMQKNLMDIALLARYVGKWKWQVKRHFRPSVFEKLSPEMVSKYAQVFNISVEELTNFGKG